MKAALFPWRPRSKKLGWRTIRAFSIPFWTRIDSLESEARAHREVVGGEAVTPHEGREAERREMDEEPIDLLEIITRASEDPEDGGCVRTAAEDEADAEAALTDDREHALRELLEAVFVLNAGGDRKIRSAPAPTDRHGDDEIEGHLRRDSEADLGAHAGDGPAATRHEVEAAGHPEALGRFALGARPLREAEKKRERKYC